jgi:hypothetical protein
MQLRFQVLTAANMKMAAFWVVAPVQQSVKKAIFRMQLNNLHLVGLLAYTDVVNLLVLENKLIKIKEAVPL